MNLKHLSSEELHKSTLTAVSKERMSTVEVLWHLRENEKTMLYAKMGYRDLQEYCVRELKYSEGSAWRRISAMKLLKEVPEIKEKIESGDLNLTQLSMAKAHFREVKASVEEKKEVLSALENQSTRHTERLLAECKPESLIPKPEVKEKAIKGKKLEVTFVLDEEFQKELEELEILLGKPMTKLELFKLLTQEKLERLKTVPKRKAQPLPKSQTRSVSQITLREVKSRDEYRCQFRDPLTGKQCTAQFHLQTEHIIPFAKGGSNELENLELLCPSHNRLRAVEQFGANKMKNYMPLLRD